MKFILFVCMFVLSITFASAQSDSSVKAEPSEVVTKLTESQKLAKAAFEAHGGATLGELNTLSIIGSVDLTSSVANQAFPASFVQLYSGEKYRLEVTSAFFQFLQVFDGVNTTTVPSYGYELPPINRVGFALLQRYDKSGFLVSDLEDKKKNGFRITSPEGLFTDFYIDKKTNRIKGYDSNYTVAGRAVKTVVEIDKFEEHEGIVIPSKFAQRFDLSGMTIYGVFKSKQITVNKDVADNLFQP